MAQFAAIATVASAIFTGANALGIFKKDTPSLAPPPPAPAPEAPPTMQSPQIDQAGAEASRRAAAAGGIMANIATGPGGLEGRASTTGKTLLGT